MVVDEKVKRVPSPEWFAGKGKLKAELGIKYEKDYLDFRAKYAPEKWADLSGDELLSFFSIGYKPNSLCYALEYAKQYKVFGTIGGGSSWLYYVFKSKKDGQWKTSLEGKNKLVSGMRVTDAEEAAELVPIIRDALFQGNEILKQAGVPKNSADYSELAKKLRKLNDKLSEEGISNFIYKKWVLKYFHMLHPEIIPCWYSEDWIDFITTSLNLQKREDYFERMGEIMLYIQKSGLSVVVFSEVFDDYFGEPKKPKNHLISNQPTESDTIDEEVNIKTSNQYPRNRIIFGAPGTGKSYLLEQEKKELLLGGGGYERVTFHPDYSYANFVGTYKPIQLDDEDNSVGYGFVQGPFMRIYVEAKKNPKKNYLLIIEEINRANMAAVFGDVFQLLDRNDDGESVYPIQTSQDVRKFLAASELAGSYIDIAEMRLPSNLYIWATMNSADQGVYPMDTAFKRRWDFEYLSIDDKEEKIENLKFRHIRTGRSYAWNDLRKAINNALIGMNVNEDKLLGPFFLKESAFTDDRSFAAAFKSKVLMYLFEDAARQKRSQLFAGCGKECNVFSKVCQKFDAIGIGIFSSDFVSKVPVLADDEQDKQIVQNAQEDK